MSRCEWFALCDHEADGTVSHPILGAVPTCQRCADRLDLHLVPWPADDPAERKPWPRIDRDVPVTPALARRFVSRNWSFGFNGHSIYQLGRDLYAVTRDDEGALVITGRVLGATSSDTADLIALLSEV